MLYVIVGSLVIAAIAIAAIVRLKGWPRQGRNGIEFEPRRKAPPRITKI